MQKPVIIYSMPRTRSTAVLQACLRDTKIFEPFNNLNLFNIRFDSNDGDKKAITQAYIQAFHTISDNYAEYANSVPQPYLDLLFAKLNDSGTVSKIICNELANFLPAREWMRTAAANNTHDIFVLVRDLREQMLSLIISHKFGFFKETECEPYEIEVASTDIGMLRRTLDNFLRFMPTNGKLITFDLLPSSHFDYANITAEQQQSLSKLSYIKNLDYCEFQIDQLITYYKKEWDNTLPNH